MCVLAMTRPNNFLLQMSTLSIVLTEEENQFCVKKKTYLSLSMILNSLASNRVDSLKHPPPS